MQHEYSPLLVKLARHIKCGLCVVYTMAKRRRRSYKHLTERTNEGIHFVAVCNISPCVLFRISFCSVQISVLV